MSCLVVKAITTIYPGPNLSLPDQTPSKLTINRMQLKRYANRSQEPVQEPGYSTYRWLLT